jgi:hypothetical protein
MVRMISQAPALFESLTGQKMSDLMSRVPALAELVPPPEPPSNGATNGTGSIGRGTADRA